MELLNDQEDAFSVSRKASYRLHLEDHQTQSCMTSIVPATVHTSEAQSNSIHLKSAFLLHRATISQRFRTYYDCDIHYRVDIRIIVFPLRYPEQHRTQQYSPNRPRAGFSRVSRSSAECPSKQPCNAPASSAKATLSATLDWSVANTERSPAYYCYGQGEQVAHGRQ